MTAGRHYRCYFTDANDKIQSVEEVVGDDDAGAALRVEQLLLASKHDSAELWQSSRLVGKWTNGRKLG
jgi:hypothetical protein